VVENKHLGRVLFFDATGWSTMLGDIPNGIQGSKVFVVASGNDELTTLPVLPVEQNRRLERRIEMTLAPTGVVAGTGSFVGRGQPAIRALLRASPKELESGFSNPYACCVGVENVKVADDRSATCRSASNWQRRNLSSCSRAVSRS
jgi:hypothetical protein